MFRLRGLFAFYRGVPGFGLSWLNLGVCRFVDIKANHLGKKACESLDISYQQWVSSTFAGIFRIGLTPLDTLCTQTIASDKSFREVLKDFKFLPAFQTGPFRFVLSSLGHFVFFDAMNKTSKVLKEHTSLNPGESAVFSGLFSGILTEMVTHPLSNVKILKQVEPQLSWLAVCKVVLEKPMRGFSPKLGSIPGAVALAYLSRPNDS
jgi:hypothetical protein